MASEIRVNQIQNRSGLSTVTFSDTGVVISGITTITDLRTSGNTIVAAGSTSAPSITPTGDSNTGIFFPSSDTIAFAEGGIEAARFDSSGRLGIGTNNPLNKVSILVNNPTSLSSSSEGLRITDETRNVQLTRTGSSYSYGGITGTGSLIYSYDTLSLQADTSNPIVFSTGLSEKVRINSSGNLGIGTNNPSEKTHIYGSGDIKLQVETSSSGLNANSALVLKSLSEGHWVVQTGNAVSGGLRIYDRTADLERLRIDSSGNFRFNSGYGSVATAYGCRAWVNVDGTTASPCTIGASGNITSVTKSSTGRLTINFTNAMPDANYGAFITSQRRDANDDRNIATFSERKGSQVIRSTTSFPLDTGSWLIGGYNGTAMDHDIINVAFFR